MSAFVAGLLSAGAAAAAWQALYAPGLTRQAWRLARRHPSLRPDLRARRNGATALAAGTALLAGLGVGPIAGPLGCLSVAPWERLIWALAERKRRRLVARASLPFLSALRALLEAGLGFSEALFRLSASRNGWLEEILGGELAAFASGRSLRGCLARFQKRLGASGESFSWSWLFEAADRGLPLLPLLSDLIAQASAMEEWEERRRAQRREAMAQAAVAGFLPWLLLAGISAAGSEWIGLYWREGPALAVALLGLAWQLVGVWVGHRESSFT